jgi:hypothetical protein
MATESLVILSDRLDMYLVEGMSFLKQGYNVESYWSLARLTLAAIWRDYPANAPAFETRVQRVFADVLLESMKREAVNA